jgi:MFS family permease
MERERGPGMKTLTLRSLAPSVFLPALIYEIGNGAIAPIIAFTALGLGASPAVAGVILTLLGVGQILGNLPSSVLVSRLGDRRAMMVAAGVATVALLVCFVAPGLPEFGLAVMVIGMCNATYYLGRQHYIIEVVPTNMRAVALSTLGGSHRIGLFLGPFVGAAVIHQFGMRSAYLVAVGAALAAALCLLAVPDLPGATETAGRAGKAERTPIRDVLRSHRAVFLTLGFAVMAVGAARSARQTVIPLWAAHIGLNATTTSLIFGVATAVDMALFYPAGRIMDQYGRLAIAVPSMAILGAGTAMLPLTHGATTLAVGAIVMSFGNGLGSGIIMTLGADVAPADARVAFLSVWRTMSDTGTATGPLLVAALAAAWTLAAGVVAIGAVGLLAAVAMWRWVPLHSAYANRRMVLAARSAAATPS